MLHLYSPIRCRWAHWDIWWRLPTSTPTEFSTRASAMTWSESGRSLCHRDTRCRYLIGSSFPGFWKPQYRCSWHGENRQKRPSCSTPTLFPRTPSRKPPLCSWKLRRWTFSVNMYREGAHITCLHSVLWGLVPSLRDWMSLFLHFLEAYHNRPFTAAMARMLMLGHSGLLV